MESNQSRTHWQFVAALDGHYIFAPGLQEPVFITDNEPELLLLMKKNIEVRALGQKCQKASKEELSSESCRSRLRRFLPLRRRVCGRSICQANNLSDRVQTFCLDWADGKSFMQQLPDLVVAAATQQR